MQLPSSGEDVEKQTSPTILLVAGPSGSGKSSLVKAGLLPAFLEGNYEIFQFRPGDHPWRLKQFKEDNWVDIPQEEGKPFSFIPPADSQGQEEAIPAGIANLLP